MLDLCTWKLESWSRAMALTEKSSRDSSSVGTRIHSSTGVLKTAEWSTGFATQQPHQRHFTERVTVRKGCKKNLICLFQRVDNDNVIDQLGAANRTENSKHRSRKQKQRLGHGQPKIVGSIHTVAWNTTHARTCSVPEYPTQR